VDRWGCKVTQFFFPIADNYLKWDLAQNEFCLNIQSHILTHVSNDLSTSRQNPLNVVILV